MFVKVPFLPTSRVTHIILDKNAPIEFIQNVIKLNIIPILSAKIENIMQSVSSHPDMQLHHIGKNTIICEPSVFNHYNMLLTSLGFKVISGFSRLNCNYPNDIAYNISRIGNIVMHNISNTEGRILEYYTNKNFRIIDTKQGYTKCATCIVAENAVITSDVGIAKQLMANGVDVLQINVGEISLSGMEYGFIGGTCGFIDKNLLAFCGKIENHSSYKEMKSFTDKYLVDIISLYDGELTDIGSVIPIMQATHNK